MKYQKKVLILGASSDIGICVINEFLNKIAMIGALLIIISGLISIPGQIKQVNNK